MNFEKFLVEKGIKESDLAAKTAEELAGIYNEYNSVKSAELEKAIANVQPMVEVRSKRVGGTNYQVPMQVKQKRQLSLAIRWVRQSVRSGSGRPPEQILPRPPDAVESAVRFAEE